MPFHESAKDHTKVYLNQMFDSSSFFPHATSFCHRSIYIFSPSGHQNLFGFLSILGLLLTTTCFQADLRAFKLREQSPKGGRNWVHVIISPGRLSNVLFSFSIALD